MNLKFHMQHDQTPRLQNSKIKSGREFKMAAFTKNSKTNKIVIFSRTDGYIWLIIVLSISRTLMLINIKIKKKSLAELGHNGRLKIYVDPKKIYVDPSI